MSKLLRPNDDAVDEPVVDLKSQESQAVTCPQNTQASILLGTPVMWGRQGTHGVIKHDYYFEIKHEV